MNIEPRTHRPAVNDRDRYLAEVADEDQLNAARGFVHGVIGGVAFWAAIAAAVWLWWS